MIYLIQKAKIRNSYIYLFLYKISWKQILRMRK